MDHVKLGLRFCGSSTRNKTINNIITTAKIASFHQAIVATIPRKA